MIFDNITVFSLGEQKDFFQNIRKSYDPDI